MKCLRVYGASRISSRQSPGVAPLSAIVMFGLAGWIGWMNLRKEGSPSPEAEKESK